MSYLRKSTSILLIFSILLLFNFNTVSALPVKLYKTSVITPVTSGATHEKITWFTAEGWLDINVLRVDLTNPNIEIDTLRNLDSFKKLTTTSSLAQSRGAIAAVNGGFFNWLKESGYGYADGPIVESGQIISAYSQYNSTKDSMATLSVNTLNEVLYDFWKMNIKLLSPYNTTINVTQYNKASLADYKDITIFDRKWGDKSIGVSKEYPDIIEMVVENGFVKEIRQAQPQTSIPPNGYVVITRGAKAKSLTDNFLVGDSITMNISTTPLDWSTLKLAITGSAILLKDGQIPGKFSYDIAGRRARTAVGSTRDGKQLILVTVDKESKSSSIGMTQYELAELMLELGAYHAINFDGGGSTTMVARKPGTTNPQVINNVSDSSERKISTALGIFSIAPVSTLDGLIIESEDSNVFVNTSRKLTVKGYDKYLNPLTIDPAKVTFSVSGIEGEFKDSIFYPKTTGQGKITATYENISSTIDVLSLSSPEQLFLNYKSLQLPLGKSSVFSLKGISTDGFTASIHPSDAQWSVKGSVGSFNQNTFTAQSSGTGYIDVSVASAHAYCPVSVAIEKNVVKDNFETTNASFTASPNTLPGAYTISKDIAYTGSSSGKLTYDFTFLEGTRAAYAVYSNGGISIEKGISKLSLWVNNNHANSNWLRIELSDANGNKQVLDMAKSMDWTGWKYLETSIQNISLPAKVTKIYLAQISPVPDSGDVYLDDLTLISSSYPQVDTAAIPKDSAPSDKDNRSVVYKKEDNSFKVSVFGSVYKTKNLLEKLLLSKYMSTAAADADVLGFVGPGEHTGAANLNKTLAVTNSGYKTFEHNGSLFIQLDTSKKGIRKSSVSQWTSLLNSLDPAAANKNVFLFLQSSPDSFEDRLEANLLKDVLAKLKKDTGKNIWVFFKGSKNAVSIDRGVKYLSTAGIEIESLTPSNALDVKYLEVIVKPDGVTYEYKSVF